MLAAVVATTPPTTDPDGADEAARGSLLPRKGPWGWSSQKRKSPAAPFPRRPSQAQKPLVVLLSPGAQQPAVTTDNCRQAEIFLGQEKAQEVKCLEISASKGEKGKRKGRCTGKYQCSWLEAVNLPSPCQEFPFLLPSPWEQVMVSHHLPSRSSKQRFIYSCTHGTHTSLQPCRFAILI